MSNLLKKLYQFLLSKFFKTEAEKPTEAPVAVSVVSTPTQPAPVAPTPVPPAPAPSKPIDLLSPNKTDVVPPPEVATKPMPSVAPLALLTFKGTSPEVENANFLMSHYGQNVAYNYIVNQAWGAYDWRAELNAALGVEAAHEIINYYGHNGKGYRPLIKFTAEGKMLPDKTWRTGNIILTLPH